MNNNALERMSLTIPTDLADWLYNAARTIKSRGGYRLPNTLIIRACIRTLKNLDIQNHFGAIKDEKKRGLANTEANEDLEAILVDQMTKALKIIHKRK